MKIGKHLLWGLAIFAATNSSAEKRYTIPRVHIEAQVQSDAAMMVSETRTYDFSGSFSYAYRTFPKNDTIRYTDVFVQEGDVLFRRNDSKEPGTFQVVEEKTKVRVLWYFSSKNESRSFTVRYQVRNLVKRHPDAGVLYYQFIGNEWQQRQNNLEIVVRPPAALAPGDLREWVHGPLWAQSRIEPDGTIIVQCKSVPSRTFIEIRALYPSNLFNAGPLSDGFIVEKIMAEEARLAQSANEQREKAIVRQATMARIRLWVKPLIFFLAAMALVIWWILYNRYGRRPARLTLFSVNSDIPDETPPALVGYLLNWRTTTGNELVATLMDLARRGFLRVVEEHETNSTVMRRKPKTRYSLQVNRSVWQKRLSEMQAFEQSALTYLFDELFEGRDSFYLDELKKKTTKLAKFFRQWCKVVKSAAEEKNYYDPQSLRGMYLSMIYGGIFFVLGMASLPFIEQWGLILIVTALATFFGSFFILHRTAEGERSFLLWKALKRYIKKYQFKNLNQSTLMNRLDRYIVYGMVFGLYKKHYQQLTANISAGQLQIYFPWYAIHGSHAGFSSASFSTAFSTMITTMSSASGFGGGATAGGGAGAGGGGGGAG